VSGYTLHPDEIPVDHMLYCHRSCIHHPENINNCELVPVEAHYRVVLLLQQDGLVLVNLCNLEFQYYKTC